MHMAVFPVSKFAVEFFTIYTGFTFRPSHWQSWEHLQGHYNCISRNY